jgi:hypothetical protein
MKTPLRLALVALAAVALASAAHADGPRKAPPAAADDVPIYDPDVVGEKAIAFYQKAALDSGRRLLLNLGTNDCAPCQTFNRALHKDKFWDAFIQQFIPADVDVSSQGNAMLIEKYHVNPKAELPAILLFMPDGRLIEALAHGEMAAIAKKGEGAVQEWLLARFAKSDK